MKHKIRDGALYKFLSLVSFFSWQNVHVANSKLENDFLKNQLWFEWYEKKRDFMIGDPFFCVILISTCNYEYNCPLFPQKCHLWINTIFAPWVHHVCPHDDTISRYDVKYFVSACDFLLIESTIITKWLYSAKIIRIWMNLFIMTKKICLVCEFSYFTGYENDE